MAETKKLRGVSLLSAIYGELTDQLPEQSVGTEELLLSAQRLIDLAKKDYVTDKNPDVAYRAGYYSHDIFTAFDKYQEHIFVNERQLSDDPLSMLDGNSVLDDFLYGGRSSIVLEDIYA